MTVPPEGVQVYYNVSALGPLPAVGLGAVLLAVFAAALAGLAFPEFAGGAAVTLAVAMFAVSVAWAAGVPESVVLELARDEELIDHRSAVVGASAVALAGAGLYAREVPRVGERVVRDRPRTATPTRERAAGHGSLTRTV